MKGPNSHNWLICSIKHCLLLTYSFSLYFILIQRVLNHIFYTCIMNKKREHSLNKLTPPPYIFAFAETVGLMYALMISSSQLKRLVHALFYVLPIWRNEALRVLMNYYNSSKTFCKDTSKHNFSTEGTLRILSRKLSRKYILKTEH